MYPNLKLHNDVDVLKHSPLVRGMILALQYADENGGNRKFVHWAAKHFEWPNYTAAELFEMHKVLNEDDMQPLWPVHDLLRYLKLLRRYRGVLVPTKKGRALAEASAAFFDLVAPVYLYQSVHDERVEARGDLLGNWNIFLNVMAHLVKTLYGWDGDDRYDRAYNDARFALLFCVVRPLCWLGLLWEDRTGLGFFGDSTYYKTPLWAASLKLDTDGQESLRLV